MRQVRAIRAGVRKEARRKGEYACQPRKGLQVPGRIYAAVGKYLRLPPWRKSKRPDAPALQMEGLIMGTKPLFISTPLGDKSPFDDFWKIKRSELEALKKKPIKKLLRQRRKKNDVLY